MDRQIRQLEFEEYERLSTDFRKAMREALQAKKRYEVVEDGIEDKLTKPKGRTIVSEETIQDIRAAYGAEQTEILHRYGDNKDEIAAKGSDDIQHRDRMTAGQVQSIVREQQQAELAECAQVARTQLQVAHEQCEKRIAKRAEAVREQLFGGIEDAAALARAATADEPELKEMLAISALTGNKELGKIAFTAAAQKGLGGLLNIYLNEVDGDARGLYEEWTQIPSKDLLDRQRANLDRLVTVPDRPRHTGRVSV